MIDDGDTFIPKGMTCSGVPAASYSFYDCINGFYNFVGSALDRNMTNVVRTLEYFMVSLPFCKLSQTKLVSVVQMVLSNEGCHPGVQTQTEIPAKNNTRRTINKEESKMCQRIKGTVMGRLLRRIDITHRSLHTLL